MGYGLLHKKVFVQRLNTKSSTEAELLGVIEYLPYILWMIFFLPGQGYGIMNNVLYQYNQIAIKMDNNRSNYCTGKLLNMNISYFCQRHIR